MRRKNFVFMALDLVVYDRDDFFLQPTNKAIVCVKRDFVN